MKRFIVIVVILCGGIVLLGQGIQLIVGTASGAPAANLATLIPGAIERVSIATDGSDPDGASGHVSISTDGCLIAFSSSASNLVGGDSNRELGVFVRNRCAVPPTTERVNVDSTGWPANGSSWEPSISGDGRYVAFSSSATNLVAGDTNQVTDVFVRDRTLGTTSRVSVSSNGVQGNGLSLHPAIAANGPIVAFVSEATNLVSGDSNGVKDVFVYNQTNGLVRRVSVSSSGGQGYGVSDNPAVSADGCYVAYESVSSLVTFDNNGRADVFVHNLCAGYGAPKGATVRVSVNSSEEEGDRESYDAAISGDGRYVAFESWATNLGDDAPGLKDVFVRDRTTGATAWVSVPDINSPDDFGDGDSGDPSITVDGDNGNCYLVVFESWATNLDPSVLEDEDLDQDSDVFLRDQCAGTTARVSLHNNDLPEYAIGREDSVDPIIVAGGQFVVFKSRTSDLVTGDDNGEADVFFVEQ